MRHHIWCRYRKVCHICDNFRNIRSRNAHDFDRDLSDLPNSNVNVNRKATRDSLFVENSNASSICHRLRDNRCSMYSIQIFDLKNEGEGCWRFRWKLANETTLSICIYIYIYIYIYMSANIDAFRSSHLFPVTVHYGRTNVRSSMLPARVTPFNSVGMM